MGNLSDVRLRDTRRIFRLAHRIFAYRRSVAYPSASAPSFLVPNNGSSLGILLIYDRLI